MNENASGPKLQLLLAVRHLLGSRPRGVIDEVCFLVDAAGILDTKVSFGGLVHKGKIIIAQFSGKKWRSHRKSVWLNMSDGCVIPVVVLR